MKDAIFKEIEKEALKHAQRFQDYHNGQEIAFQRNKRRINNPPPKEVKVPSYWAKDKKFNPFFVLKHKEKISKSVLDKIKNGEYKPFEPVIYSVNKKGGGQRSTTVYQIPDAAVSNYIYRRLLNKNKHRFSSLAYAYRNDRNVHYAIQDIALEFRHYSRLFIAEFDFRDFFGSIKHEFLFEQLDKNGFLISSFEKVIIKAFIETNKQGIPQGGLCKA